MKITKRRRTITWIKRTFLFLLLILVIWIANLIWFKPMNIEHLYNRTFIKVMLKNPELVTTFDVPVLNRFAKSKLNDVSDESSKAQLEILKNEFKILQSYDFEKLSDANKLNNKILSWYLNNQIEGEDYFYQPYSFDHLSSSASEFPRLMQEYHKLNDESDIKAYLSRLEKFPDKMNQSITKDSIRVSKGTLPPDFIIEKTIGVIKNIIDSTDQNSKNSYDVKSNVLYTTLKDGLSKIEDLSNDDKNKYLKQAETTIKSKIVPAYLEYVNRLQGYKTKATSEAGVWKLKNGDAYYRFCLKTNTTTDMDPETIHQIGVSEVARIQVLLRDIVNQHSDLDSSIPIEDAINHVAFKTDNFLFAPTSNAEKTLKDQLLSFYRSVLTEADTLFAPIFNIMPKSKLVVKETPAFLGVSATNQYRYTNGEGVFYTNILKIKEQDSIPLVWQKSLAYHEGIPGHHFQIAIQRELKNVPMFRNVLPFSAYTEGWGLYAEWLANEVGAYKNDPAGNAGRLLAELHRAVRLVVDTGIHFKRWTREEAITYMSENLYVSREGSEKEIDRYIVMPGQACAYKVGMLKILELRKKAENALGVEFDVRAFHDVVLKNGSVPLDVLEVLVNDYIEKSI